MAVICVIHVQANRYGRFKENAIFAVTIIEIRPFRNGWRVHEAPGLKPVFLDREGPQWRKNGNSAGRTYLKMNVRMLGHEAKLWDGP